MVASPLLLQRRCHQLESMNPLKDLLLQFHGGDKRIRRENWLGLRGKSFVHQKMRVGWTSKFRDLKALNLALLTKQGWRIQQDPRTLVHRVFKAKYFADTTFKEAQLDHRPSYVWRSLLAAKDIVVNGTRWVVGNGESVNIWEDRWIPTPNSFKVVSLRIPLESWLHAS
ncbi:hypothetical protein ACB092_09G207800 [Castanea dentata]